jgi:hypothetical protein
MEVEHGEAYWDEELGEIYWDVFGLASLYGEEVTQSDHSYAKTGKMATLNDIKAAMREMKDEMLIEVKSEIAGVENKVIAGVNAKIDKLSKDFKSYVDSQVERIDEELERIRELVSSRGPNTPTEGIEGERMKVIEEASATAAKLWARSEMSLNGHLIILRNLPASDDLPKEVSGVLAALKAPSYLQPIKSQRIGVQKQLVLVEFASQGAASELVGLGKNLRQGVFKNVYIERKKSPFCFWYERRMMEFRKTMEKEGMTVKRSGNGLMIGGTKGEIGTKSVFIPAVEFAGNSVILNGTTHLLRDPPDEREHKRKPPKKDKENKPGKNINGNTATTEGNHLPALTKTSEMYDPEVEMNYSPPPTETSDEPMDENSESRKRPPPDVSPTSNPLIEADPKRAKDVIPSPESQALGDVI